MRIPYSLPIALILALTVSFPGSARADVDERGRYTTQVPIEVPPFYGITPTVELVYQSLGGSGLAGVGWQLVAGSTIVRRSSTNGTPQFAGDDIFFLDGQELVPCASGSASPSCTSAIAAFGSATNFFSTRIESYERIRFDDPVAGRWTVWGRDGTRRAYASGDDGLSYTLRTVTDTHSNQVNYAWACASSVVGPCELDAITYGARGAAPGAEIRFYRETRPDQHGVATGRGRAMHVERLRSIVVQHDGQLVRAYSLQYDVRGSQVTGASVLTSIQQFGRDAKVDAVGKITEGATPPLPAMKFASDSLAKGAAWELAPETTQPDLFKIGQGPALSPIYARPYTDLHVPVGSGGPGPDPWPSGTVVGDFDGDGRADIVAWGPDSACAHVSLTGHLSTPAGPRPIVAASIQSGFRFTGNPDNWYCTAQVLAADVNGDGRDDVVIIVWGHGDDATKIEKNLRIALAQRDGTFVPGPGDNWTITANGNQDCVAVDVDGDGRDDLVCQDPVTGTIRTYRAKIGSWAVTEIRTGTTAPPKLPNHIGLRILGGDVDGDGLGDVVLAYPTGATTRVILGRSLGDGTYNWSEEQNFNFQLDKTDGFYLTDIDGDGRLDLVYTSTRAGTPTGDPGTTIQYALARKGWPTMRWNLQSALGSPLTDVQFVDLDGDGRADLLGGGADVSHQLQVQFANPMGGFFPVDPAQTTCGDGGAKFRAIAVDLNGDGLADPFCIETIADGEFRLIDRPSQSRGTDRHRWMRADVNGDGRPQLVYIQFTNPGYTIYMVSPVTQTRTSFVLVPGAGTAPLAEPDASRWIVADVGSPSGPADGKDDLVLVEEFGRMLHVTTLLATGSGTFAVYHQALWPSYPDLSTKGWIAAQLARDARAEIIRLRPAPQAGVIVDMLRPAGPGLWTTDSRTHFTSGAAPMFDRSLNRFLPTDVNGDRLTDLVHIETPPDANATIRTLRADGHGDFVEVVSTIPASSVDSRHWRLGDLDGDGAPDLIHVAITGSTGVPCLTISQLAGDGLGGFDVGGADGVCFTTTDPLYTRLFEDSSNVVLIDLDGDGADEIVHTTHAADAGGNLHFIVTRLKRDPAAPIEHWKAFPEVIALAFDYGDAWSWTAHRDSLTGAAGLAYVHSQAAFTLNWRGPTDELTSIENGIGLSTSIAYGPYLNSRAYLPAGYVPRIAQQLVTRDNAYSPPVGETVDYAYKDARWSDRDGVLAGYGATRATDSHARHYRYFAISDTCRSTLIRTETVDLTTANIWGYTDIQYIDPGANPPFLCMPKATQRSECELSASCRMAARVDNTYDAYGNVVGLATTIDLAKPTLVYAPVNANVSDYIVDRLAFRLTLGLTTTGWKGMALRNFYYDYQPLNASPLALGELTAVADYDDQESPPVLRTTSYTYDAGGFLTQIQSPGGKVKTITPDTTYGRFPEVLCDVLPPPPGLCTHQVWDFVIGKVTNRTDPAGGTEITTYDAFARVAKVDHPGGGFTGIKYLDTGTLTGPIDSRQRTRTEISDNSPVDGVLWSESFFDGSSRIYRASREGGATVTTAYADSSARPEKMSLVYDAASNPSRWIQFEYDGLGRNVTVVQPDGARSTNIYSVGKMEHRDELGAATVRSLDGAGKVIAITESTNAVTNYEYDPLGRLVAITDHYHNQVTNDWSTLGRLVGSTDPDRGKRTFGYYDDGELSSRIDAKGQRIDWVYDYGRPKSRTDKDSSGTTTRTVTWEYDDDGTHPHGFSRGRMFHTNDSQAGATISREPWYDAAGRTTRTRTCIDGTCMDEETHYDDAGRVSMHVYPDATGSTTTPAAESLVYQYDEAGNLKSVGSYIKQIVPELDGRPHIINYGNGVGTTLNYDPDRRWLDSLDIRDPSNNTIQNFAYTRHDPVGRIKHQVATGTHTIEFGYTYDDLGRLRKVDSPNSARVEEFNYDLIGRLRWSAALGGVHYIDPAHVHGATSADRGGTRAYDVNGNVKTLQDPGGRDLTLEWTVDDYVAEVTDVGPSQKYRFWYDAGGRRVKKEGPAGTWRSFGPRIALDEKGRLIKNYFAGDLLLARNDGAVSYYHTDVSQAVRFITDQTGKLVAAYQYAAFGQPVAGSAVSDNEFGFSTARQDAALGLIAMGARTYDPILGQFLSADSIIPDPYRPQSLNRYRYVENDPINHWDPSGHMSLQVEMRKQRFAEALFPVPSSEPAVCRSAAAPPQICKDALASLFDVMDAYHPLPPRQDRPLCTGIQCGAISEDGDGEGGDGTPSPDNPCAGSQVCIWGPEIEVKAPEGGKGYGLARGMFGPNATPRETTELDYLAAGFLLAPPVIVGAAFAFPLVEAGALVIAVRAPTLVGLLMGFLRGEAGLHESASPAATGGAANVAAHEAYKDALRAAMSKPAVSDPVLSRLVDEIYRPLATVGSGSTAAAVRQELSTGQAVGGAFHSQKALDSIRALGKWLANNPTARPGDRAAAENIIRDMSNALRGQ